LDQRVKNLNAAETGKPFSSVQKSNTQSIFGGNASEGVPNVNSGTIFGGSSKTSNIFGGTTTKDGTTKASTSNVFGGGKCPP